MKRQEIINSFVTSRDEDLFDAHDAYLRRYPKTKGKDIPQDVKCSGYSIAKKYGVNSLEYTLYKAKSYLGTLVYDMRDIDYTDTVEGILDILAESKPGIEKARIEIKSEKDEQKQLKAIVNIGNKYGKELTPEEIAKIEAILKS